MKEISIYLYNIWLKHYNVIRSEFTFTLCNSEIFNTGNQHSCNTNYYVRSILGPNKLISVQNIKSRIAAGKTK